MPAMTFAQHAVNCQIRTMKLIKHCVNACFTEAYLVNLTAVVYFIMAWYTLSLKMVWLLFLVFDAILVYDSILTSYVEVCFDGKIF